MPFTFHVAIFMGSRLGLSYAAMSAMAPCHFHASLDLARRVDLGEIRFCALAARVGQAGGASALEVGGGMALCGAPGSPFNKVLGLGLGAAVSDADLDAIDEFYDERGVASQIELCPLAAQGLAPRLAVRGYTLQGFENQLARVLDGTDHGQPSLARRCALPPSFDVAVAPAVRPRTRSSG